LLGFWLEMPMHEYLDDLEGVGPALAKVIRESRPAGPPGRRRHSGPPLNLKRLIAGTDPMISSIPPEELTILLERLKLFAKRVHRSVKHGGKEAAARGPTRRESSMPVEVAQVLYNLAGALALTRCGTRIIGLGDDRYRKNVSWVLKQSWLDTKLRPVFVAALKELDVARGS